MKVTFSAPDQYGEIHAKLECELNTREEIAYFELEVNENQTEKYRLDYHDAGTVGYAAGKGQYAVNGRLINMSMDWANSKPGEIGIINVIGTIDNGFARLHLWRKSMG